MGESGDLSLANKFGFVDLGIKRDFAHQVDRIILGCIVFVVFGAGLVKLYINKRR
jgi:hypothetical protein